MLQSGIIKSIADNTQEYRISFSLGYFSFDVVVGSDCETQWVTMKNPQGDQSGMNRLAKQYEDAVRIPSVTVYTGKLNWFQSASNEMITLVMPTGITNGAPVGLYYQWTVDAKGRGKQNSTIDTIFRDVFIRSDGFIQGTFDDGCHLTFRVTLFSDRGEARIEVLSEHDKRMDVVTAIQTDFRDLGRKKKVRQFSIESVPSVLTRFIGQALIGHQGIIERLIMADHPVSSLILQDNS